MAAIINGVPVAMPPPEGYVVDFDNPERNSVTAAYWLFGVGNFLSLLFMAQRGFVRLVIQKTFKVEDACLVVAYGFSIALQCIILHEFIRGVMGTHAWEMPLYKFGYFLRALYLLPILYNPVQCCAKMSLLLVYRRLAPLQWFHIMVWSTGFVVVGSSVAITFATIFPCNPVQSAWDVTNPAPKCIDRNAVYKATAALGAATDVMVLAVPIPVVLPLQISIRQKIGLVCFFGIGGVTVFTSIMRLVALINSMGVVDQTWGGGPVLLWIFAEANLSCICAAMTTSKIFIKHISPRILGTTDPASKTGPGFSTSAAPSSMGGGVGTNSKNRHDKYERFDDGPMYPLQTVANVQASRDDDHQQQHNYHNKADTTWYNGRRNSSNNSQGESGSEKAIVQTRTTTVTYST